jgi:hypothetical protein
MLTAAPINVPPVTMTTQGRLRSNHPDELIAEYPSMPQAARAAPRPYGRRARSAQPPATDVIAIAASATRWNTGMLPLSVVPAYLNNPFLNAPGSEKHHGPAIARPVPMRKLDARRSLDDSGRGRSSARTTGDIDPKNVCVLTSTSLPANHWSESRTLTRGERPNRE